MATKGTNRDFVVDLGGISGAGTSHPDQGQSAVQRARNVARTGQGGSILERIAKAQIARRVARSVAARASGAAFGARSGALRAAATPAGFAAIAAILGTKAITGQTFETMGENFAEFLFGDMDDKARASRTTRERILGNEVLTRSAAALGSGEVLPIYELLRSQELDRQKARAAILRDTDFQAKELSDIIVDGVIDGAKRAWEKVADDVESIIGSIGVSSVVDTTVAGMAMKALRSLFK